MGAVDLTLEEHVALVTLNSDDNRFNPAFMHALLDILNQIETDTPATTLIVHSAHEKIFSNGIDLDWLLPVLQRKDWAAAKQFFYQLNQIFKRLVTYPLVTIAAVSGHAFAAGAIFSCAFDFRFMRSDRGYFCLPEVDLGMPFLPGMNALLHSVIPEAILREMQLTGVRLTAEACRNHHIVKDAYPVDQLLEKTLAYGKQIKKARRAVAQIKQGLNCAVLHAMEVDDVAFIESGRYYPGQTD